MDQHTARLIIELRKRYSYRAIAETYWPKQHPSHGNQGEGEELVKEAASLLGCTPDEHHDDFVERFDRASDSVEGTSKE